MRTGLLILVLIATLFGSGYWYQVFEGACRIPIQYRIGNVDARFGTSNEELLRIAKNSEQIWEKETGKDLFVYDANASFLVNLVFDDRQKNAQIEEELRVDLQAKEGMSESVAKQYEALIKEFRDFKKGYESEVIAYETKLKTYNDTVTDWNTKGGAPASVVSDLERTQQRLTVEQTKLEEKAKTLNQLVVKLNAIGARGNSLITDYNSIVHTYNDRFSEASEFTQGEYTGKEINIYQFDSEKDLEIVFAHEFGHALSLSHVTNEQSIMYPHMGKQVHDGGVSVEDIVEYNRVCDQNTFALKVLSGWTGILNHFFPTSVPQATE
jgi:hypothetical protein